MISASWTVLKSAAGEEDLSTEISQQCSALASHNQQTAFELSRLRRQARYRGALDLSGGLLSPRVCSMLTPRWCTDLGSRRTRHNKTEQK